MSAQGKAEQEFQQEYEKAIERIRTMPDGAVGTQNPSFWRKPESLLTQVRLRLSPQ